MTIDYSKWDAIECSSSDSEEFNDAEANDDYNDDDFEGEEVVERDTGEKKNDENEKEPMKQNDEKRDALHENYDVVVGERLFKEDEKLNKMKEMFYDYTIERDMKRVEKEYREKQKRNPQDFSMTYEPSGDKEWRAVGTNIFSVALCEFPKTLRKFLKRVGKENGKALEDFDEYLKRRRERRERNDDDSDDDSDDEEYGWDSERKNFRMPGEFMSLINSYIDEGEQRRRDRGYSDWADFLHPDHALDDEQVIATMRKT